MSQIKNAPGKYIVIDGIDGGGKGALFESLKMEFPINQGAPFDVCFTREPGGTLLGEKIRNLLLYKDMSPETEMDLFHAQRRELRSGFLANVLAKGTHVISDRSDSSTFAYQIRGNQSASLEREFWEKRVTFLPLPTFYIFLDLDPVVAASRIAGRSDRKGDRFDTKNIEFFTRVRKGFIDFAEEVPIPSVFVDASLSKADVASIVTTHVRHHLVE